MSIGIALIIGVVIGTAGSIFGSERDCKEKKDKAFEKGFDAGMLAASFKGGVASDRSDLPYDAMGDYSTIPCPASMPSADDWYHEEFGND